MTISDLQKKTAEVLGVSSSEKELAFEVLITKVAALLTQDLTMKVPRIGFFQLREDDNENSLIFSPLSEDFTKETRTLYLTIELPKTYHPEHENDSGVSRVKKPKTRNNSVNKKQLRRDRAELLNKKSKTMASLQKSMDEAEKEFDGELQDLLTV